MDENSPIHCVAAEVYRVLTIEIDLFTDTAAILDSIVLAKTLWDAQGANDPKTVHCLFIMILRQVFNFVRYKNV